MTTATVTMTTPSSSSSSSSSLLPSKLQLETTLSPPLLSGSPAWQITFSIDGKYLAACFGNPGTCIKIWECRSSSSSSSSSNSNSNSSKEMKNQQQQQQTQQQQTRPLNNNNNNNNNTTIESSSSSSSSSWHLLTTIREGHSRTIRSLAFAPLSNASIGKGNIPPILATASFDGKVCIWEYFADDDDDDDNNYNMPQNENNNNSNSNNNNNNNERGAYECTSQLEGHENEVKCLAWNATGSLLASCGRDKTIWIWECFLPGTVGGAAATTPGAGTGGGGIGGGGTGEDDGGEFECLAVLQGHDGDIKSISFAPSNGIWGEGEEILISASYDNSIKVWAEEGDGDWYCAATLGAVHSSTVWSLGIAPGGVRFLSGSEDGSMAIWKCYTANERKRLFPNESAVSSTDGLWNCVGILPDAHSGYAILSIDCAPSRVGHGRIVSGGGDNSIHVYREEMTSSRAPVVVAGGGGGEKKKSGDMSNGPKFAYDAVAINAHGGDVNCVKWHPRDGTCLVSAGDDGAVKLWRYIRE